MDAIQSNIAWGYDSGLKKCGSMGVLLPEPHIIVGRKWIEIISKYAIVCLDFHQNVCFLCHFIINGFTSSAIHKVFCA